MHDMLSLEGKAVLVTGAGSGLGTATARAFADAGCTVVCVDIDGKALERVVARETGSPSSLLAFPCDVSNAAQVLVTVQQSAERLGRLDIVVNCAAIDYTYAIEELSIDQWDRELSVNLRAPFLFAKAAWPYLKRQGGHIFNVASTAALRSWANAAPYLASKRGLVGLSQGLSVEGRAHNIRVTTILPGGMKTHFFDRFVDQGIPLPDPERLQEPEVVASTIVFAARIPTDSAIQELLITPVNETSWP